LLGFSRRIRCARSGGIWSRPVSSEATSRCPGTLFTIGGVTHHAGQAGGASRCATFHDSWRCWTKACSMRNRSRRPSSAGSDARRVRTGCLSDDGNRHHDGLT
jgi:hypothetical protein